MEKNIVPIAMPGIHEQFYPYLKKILQGYAHPRILEIGSGHGAFTQRLWQDGYHVVATDLFPEFFYFKELSCLKLDVREKMPFEPASFDLVIAVEVMEHIYDHEIFFKECSRVLTNEGKLVFSTPNILSVKSRIRFALSGFFYAFKPLEHEKDDGLQHVSSLTVDQYVYLGIRYRMKLADISIDKMQRTSRIFLLPFYLTIRIYCRLKKINPALHNSHKLLVGRILFICFSRY